MNPMIRKELRQRMRERRSWILPTIYLLILGATVFFAYFTAVDATPYGYDAEQGSTIGVTIFLVTVIAQLTLLLLLAPVFSAGTLTMLLTSLLSSGEIWFGKFVSALMFLTLLLVSSLPVLALVFSLGGIGPEDLVRAAGMTLLILASVCALGLYFSSVFRRSVHSTAVCYACVIALCALTGVIYAMLVAHWDAVVTRMQVNVAPPMPRYYHLPLYFNPYYALITSLTHTRQKMPDSSICAIAFAGLALLATALAFRNIRRRGELG